MTNHQWIAGEVLTYREKRESRTSLFLSAAGLILLLGVLFVGGVVIQ